MNMHTVSSIAALDILGQFSVHDLVRSGYVRGDPAVDRVGQHSKAESEMAAREVGRSSLSIHELPTTQ